jgi:hypothetical protein
MLAVVEVLVLLHQTQMLAVLVVEVMVVHH